MRTFRSRLRLGAALTVMAVVAVGGTASAQTDASPAAGSGASVVPPAEAPLGEAYADWGARWWQWILTVPPIEDPAVSDCQAGQGGEVFYLPHVPPGMSITTDCSVAADQWILASAGGTIWDNSDGSGSTPEELAALVEADIPVFSDPAVIIDGEEVADIESYWVTNSDFTLEYGADNPFGFPEGTWDAAMGGWFVMIPPMEPGSHTIVVRDSIDDPTDDAGPMVAELTANVTVGE